MKLISDIGISSFLAWQFSRIYELVCKTLIVAIVMLNFVGNAQQQACWSGTWSGTRKFTASSCGFKETTQITITVSVANGNIVGSGFETGVYCYDPNTCVISSNGASSGPLTGTVSSNFFDVSGSWLNSCNGQSYPIHLYGTLSGCSIVGGTALLLSRQSGCDTCKTTPSISWSNPTTITYGTPLGAAQLNATANVPGTFVYTPASGAVLDQGTQTLSVSFTPTDTVDYSAASSSVSLVVLPATATVSGQVTCSCDNSAVSGVTVSIGKQSVQTDSGGNYSISGLSQQVYTVTVSAPYYSAVTSSLTITSASPVQKNFTLTPNGTDPALVNTIVPANNVVVFSIFNEPVYGPHLPAGAIYATFTPAMGLNLSEAACRLGFDHFNWVQEAASDAYEGVFDCDSPTHVFIDPPPILCRNGRPNLLPDPNTGLPTWPANTNGFYWNENGNTADPYNLVNENNGATLFFQDSPNLGTNQVGTVADFTTFLVGVRKDSSYVTLRQFSWKSTFSVYGGGVIAASLLQVTNGTGTVQAIVTNLQPVQIPANVMMVFNQHGGAFPIGVQPDSQEVVSGANVALSVYPTNFASPLNCQWRINGTNILNATNLTLVLTGVKSNITGNYDAVLSSSNSSIASAVSTLKVLNEPLFQSPIVITNSLLLSWAAAQGKVYQLQYKTNLNQSNWVNLGSPVTASNTAVFATNILGSDRQRFYRVQQQ